MRYAGEVLKEEPTMRVMLVAAVAALALAGHAAAQGGPTGTTVQCLEPGGRLAPATCQGPESRLDPHEKICTCQAGGLKVVAPVCAKGESPPPEGKALMIARRTAAADGALVGDTFEGRPICVRPRVP
jgi:hypothetical protein